MNICLKENDSLSFCSLSIANKFKDIFSNLAQNLIEKTPTIPNKFNINSLREFYQTQNLEKNCFSFYQSLWKDHILELKTNKATGIDNLLGRFLKDEIKVLATPIAHICSLSIKLSAVLYKFKITKVKPFYKKGKKIYPKNYRPNSLLPVISQIHQKIIHDQTIYFVTKNNVFYKFQSVFRKFHSTDFCFLDLQDEVAKGFDSGLLTGMILIDLQKAFDTIDHKMPIEKVKRMGFSNHVTKWFEYYLSKRMFSVNVENSFSDKSLINCGVLNTVVLTLRKWYGPDSELWISILS